MNLEGECVMTNNENFFKTVKAIIDMNGNFIAAVSPEKDKNLVSVRNFPFCLKYAAGDHFAYSGVDNSQLFSVYMRQLKEFCDKNSHLVYVRALYQYLSKGCLMKDLVSCGAVSKNDTDVSVFFYIKTDSIAEK